MNCAHFEAIALVKTLRTAVANSTVFYAATRGNQVAIPYEEYADQGKAKAFRLSADT